MTFLLEFSIKRKSLNLPKEIFSNPGNLRNEIWSVSDSEIFLYPGILEEILSIPGYPKEEKLIPESPKALVPFLNNNYLTNCPVLF